MTSNNNAEKKTKDKQENKPTIPMKKWIQEQLPSVIGNTRSSEGLSSKVIQSIIQYYFP